MGQTSDDIRYDVERARARLGADLNELEYRIKSELDWRVQFRRHPWAFLGAAFGLAFLIGLAISGGSRRRAPAPR
jgi:hypothetical protein